MAELSCEVIRDLLPVYADDLASGETRRLVESHVAACADCRAALDAMRAPEAPSAEDKAELDYLKKNRRRGRRAVLRSILGAAAVFLAVLAIRIFAIGDAGREGWLWTKGPKVNGSAMELALTPKDSADAVGGVRVSEENGVVSVTARRVLPSPIHPGNGYTEFTASQDITRVLLDGQVIWDDGGCIWPFTGTLYARRQPYVGDASGVHQLASSVFEGGFRLELETDAEPYGAVLLVGGTEAAGQELPAKRLQRLEPELRAGAYAMLALVQNLDHVSFAFGAPGETHTFTVTAAEATAFFGRDIKDCYDSPALFQTLLDQANLHASVWLSAGTDPMVNLPHRFVNLTDLNLKSMTLTQLSQGEAISSETGMNADESLLTPGDSLYFSVTDPMAGEEYTLRLSFVAEDGTEYSVELEPYRLTSLDLLITGDPDTGFTLETG